MKVLMNVYACKPFQGSEPGIGWNWINSMSKYCSVIAVTAEHNREFIEVGISSLDYPENVNFIYYDFNYKNFKLPRLLHHFFWQKNLVKYLVDNHIFNDVDLVHHVTYMGFREHDYLWKSKKPYIWGPVGGAQNSKFLLSGIWGSSIFFEVARDLLNWFMLHLYSPIRKTLDKSDFIFVSDSTTFNKLPKKYSSKYELMSDIGIYEEMISKPKSIHKKKKIRVVWSGLLIPRKALPILLKVAKNFGPEVDFIVIGEGSHRRMYESYIQKNNLKNVILKGRVTYSEMQKLYSKSDLFLFTSLRDTTGTVVLEAMAKGIPTIVLNQHGAADAVGENGIKIPLNSISQIVADITQQINNYLNGESYFKDVVKYQTRRLKEIYLHDLRAKRMFKKYEEVLKEYKK